MGVFDDDQSSASDEEVVHTPIQCKGRKMDALLDRLRRKHDGSGEARPDGGADDDPAPSCSTHDASTNLVLKPLPQSVDEHTVLAEFGRFGKIGSIKIIWPRGDRPTGPGNTGFVAFMKREDADMAMRHMGGMKFHGNVLSINFGDPVPLPSVPLNPDGPTMAANPASTRQRLEDGPAPKAVLKGVGPDVVVTPPDTARRRYIIDTTAVYVARDGSEFEDAVRERASNNPEFAFLNCDGPEHVYYTWRVWSLCNGDSLTSWRVEPFLMTMEGPLWIPPPTTTELPSSCQGKAADVAPGETALDRAARERLQDLLTKLSLDRDSIAAAMMFAIENAECCSEVSRRILQALESTDERDVQRKLCLLYLVSDILYNTTSRMPNASLYRASLQRLVPRVFASILASPTVAASRLSKAAVLGKLRGVLSAWRESHVIEGDVLDKLSADADDPV